MASRDKIDNEARPKRRQRVFGRLNAVVVRFPDLSQARRWYGDALGLVEVFENPAERLVVYAIGGGALLTLWESDAPLQGPSNRNYPGFGVADARAVYATLTDRGVELGQLVEHEAVTCFRFPDPAGKPFEAGKVRRPG